MHFAGILYKNLFYILECFLELTNISSLPLPQQFFSQFHQRECILFSKTGLVIVGLFLIFSFATGNNPLSLIGNLLGGGSTDFSTAKTALQQICE